MLGFEIAKYHEEWYVLLEKFPRLSIQAFRGSGKTNFMVAYLLWKAISRDNLNVLITSATFEQAKLVLKIGRLMITDNELLRQYASIGKEATWKATELTIKNGSVFYSRTYGEAVKGLRIDYVLCDEGGQYEDKSIFWVAISPVVQLNRGRIIVIGTPTSHIDLLHELKENDEYYASEYPAERDGKPLWKQKYTCEREDAFGRRSLFKVRREIGELPYMQEFLLIPISSANSLFPLDLTLKSTDNGKKFLNYGKINERYYVGCDFALSETGDYTVYTVISETNEGKKIVFADRFRGNFEQQKIKIKKIYNDFKPIKIVMDKTGLGEQIFRELSQIIPNCEPIHFTADEKYKLIMDLRHEFETFNIEIPNTKDDAVTYAYSQQLLKELNEFTIKVNTGAKLKFGGGKFDDCVISLALANRASLQIHGDVSIGFI